MSKKYIWTNHASKRLQQRKIPRRLIDQALYHPDKILSQSARVAEQQKQIDGRTVAVIVKTQENGERIILSCWVNPPFPGTRDYKLRQRYLIMRKSSFMKKLWLSLLTKLGL